MRTVNVGIIGWGNICGIYFQNLARFPVTQVVACADLIPERANAKAAEHSASMQARICHNLDFLGLALDPQC